MILFHSDIDNTIIYSYKHDIGTDTVGVEIYQDRMISFMTARSYALLKHVAEKIIFVPTTTRTVEQYGRIDLGIPVPEYALVCNGGILLEHGQENGKWYEDSLKLVEEAKEELLLARDYLTGDRNRCFEVRNIRDLFLFTKSENPMETVQGLQNTFKTSQIDIFYNGAKVYVMPKNLNKGRACERLKEKLGAEFQIAAGDSELDVPMLESVNLAIAPKSLCDICHVDAQAWHDDGKEVFSDFLLEYVLRKIPFIGDKTLQSSV